MTIPAPDFEWGDTLEYAHVESPLEAEPFMTGIHTQEVPERKYHLMWKHADDTAMEQLEAEVEATKGGAGTTSYTPKPRDPASPPSAVNVWVEEDSFSAVWKNHGWEMHVTLVEEFNPLASV